MSNDVYKVFRTKFANFTNSRNGGVISITRDVSLDLRFCTFLGCKVTQQYLGGGVFFQSSKSFLSNRNCAFDCSANSGYFIYLKGSTNVAASLNMTMTTRCSGDARAVFYLYRHDLFSRDYNSTHCLSGIHCNVHVFNNILTNVRFYHLYKNKQDILLGGNTESNKLTFSYVSFIKNEKTDGLYGYIHSYGYSTEVITLDNIFAYGNLNKIINPHNGKIIVKSFYGDEFTCTGNGQLSTEYISTSKGYVKNTVLKHILACDITKLRIANIIRKRSDFVSLCLFIFLCS